MPSLRGPILDAMTEAFRHNLTENDSRFAALGLVTGNINLEVTELELVDMVRRELPVVEIHDNLESDRVLLIGQKTSTYNLEPIVRIVFKTTLQDIHPLKLTEQKQVDAFIEALKQVHIRNTTLSGGVGGDGLWKMTTIRTLTNARTDLVEVLAANTIVVSDQSIFT